MNLLKLNINIKVKSTAHYVPKDFEVSNEEIIELNPELKLLPKSAKDKLAKSISKRFGFSTRCMIRVPGLENQVDRLSCEALATECLSRVYDPRFGKVDYFIMGTTTSSRYTGSQATSVLSSINQFAPAIEMKAGCSTSLASLYTGIMALKAGHRNALIICAETMSKIVNDDIRETWFGLADGCAGIWIEQTNENADFKLKGMLFGTNGHHVNMFTTQGKFPPNQADLDNGGYVLSGDGDELRELSLKYYGKMIMKYKDEFVLDNVTHIIPHQVNNSIITEVVNTHFDPTRVQVLMNNNEIGNIGGASVLYTLSDAIQKNTFQAGDQILMMSVGGGLSYSMHLWEKL